MPRRIATARIETLETHLREHHRVVTTAELRDLGLRPAYARRKVTEGVWTRVHDGVFCAHTGSLSRESRWQAALCYAGKGAALDGPSAAELHGLVGYERERTHVVVPHGRDVVSQSSVKVTQSRSLSDRSVQIRQRMRVVRVERALLACALLWPALAGGVLTAGVQQGLTTAERLRGTLFGLGRIKGGGGLLTVLADIEGGSRSQLERLFVALLRRVRLPLPQRNFALVIGARRLWLDLAYPALRIAIEIDGRAYHLMSEDWENDLVRQNLVSLDGWLILRFTARAIREEPHVVAETVARALALRAAS